MLKTIKLRSVNVITSGLTGSLSEEILTSEGRNISIPFNLDFNPMDQSDLIEDFIETKLDESINEIANYEVVRWTPSYNFVESREVDSVVESYQFQFDFWDSVNSIWVNDFSIVDFTSDDISIRNNFKKSFFRLDFYNTNDVNTQKLLFNLVIPASNSSGSTSSFLIRSGFEGYNLFWLKDDFIVPYQINNVGNIYMKPTFYNAKNGKVYSFFRPTDLSGNTVSSPPTFSEYNTYFKDWSFLKYNLHARRRQYSNSLLTQKNYITNNGNTGLLTFNQGNVIIDTCNQQPCIGQQLYRGFKATQPITVNVIMNVTATPSGTDSFTFIFSSPNGVIADPRTTNIAVTWSFNTTITLQPNQEIRYQTSSTNVNWSGSMRIINVSPPTAVNDLISLEFINPREFSWSGVGAFGDVYTVASSSDGSQNNNNNIIRFVEIKIQ